MNSRKSDCHRRGERSYAYGCVNLNRRGVEHKVGGRGTDRTVPDRRGMIRLPKSIPSSGAGRVSVGIRADGASRLRASRSRREGSRCEREARELLLRGNRSIRVGRLGCAGRVIDVEKPAVQNVECRVQGEVARSRAELGIESHILSSSGK